MTGGPMGTREQVVAWTKRNNMPRSPINDPSALTLFPNQLNLM